MANVQSLARAEIRRTSPAYVYSSLSTNERSGRPFPFSSSSFRPRHPGDHPEVVRQNRPTGVFLAIQEAFASHGSAEKVVLEDGHPGLGLGSPALEFHKPIVGHPVGLSARALRTDGVVNRLLGVTLGLLGPETSVTSQRCTAELVSICVSARCSESLSACSTSSIFSLRVASRRNVTTVVGDFSVCLSNVEWYT